MKWQSLNHLRYCYWMTDLFACLLHAIHPYKMVQDYLKLEVVSRGINHRSSEVEAWHVIHCDLSNLKLWVNSKVDKM